MPLQILGLNHNTAPVEIREQVVFAGDEIPRALANLSTLDGVDEALLLSTCNRTEFYVISEVDGRERLKEWLKSDRKLDDSFNESLFTLDDDAAIRHIFRVACGLDSMVLGEPQILGQLKDAFRHAQQAETLGSNLSRLFQHTFAVAKKIRTDTEIGASPVSVASAAVNLAQQFFAGFKKHTALLVGAGVTIELVAKHLVSRNIGRLFVANRSVDRAQQLAKQFGGFALPLSEIEGTLPEADILITSTSAPHAIITTKQMQEAIKARKRKPIFAVDIAVPRDIEEGVSELDDVYLYTIDDLDKVIQEGQGNREAAAVEAHRLLDEEIRRYASIERSKQVAPIIATLRDNTEAVRKQIAAKALQRLSRGASAEEAIEFATAALMKKILHQPSVTLRKAGEVSDQELIDAARRLFDLDRT
jgi:glutamyl-tRNA reductase